MRIRPYKNTDQRIDGAVLALFDIDTSKRQQALLRDAQAYTELLLRTLGEPIVVLDHDLRIRTASRAFCDMLDLSAEGVVNKHVLELGDGWDAAAVSGMLEAVRDGRETAGDVELNRDGRALRLIARRIQAGSEAPPVILVSLHGAGIGRPR